jgi:hypothetical protein
MADAHARFPSCGSARRRDAATSVVVLFFLGGCHSRTALECLQLASSPDERSEIRDITPQWRSSYAKRQAQASGVTSRGHLSAATKGQDPGCRHSGSRRAFTPVFNGLWTRVNAL